jgi:hypothetical protein
MEKSERDKALAQYMRQRWGWLANMGVIVRHEPGKGTQFLNRKTREPIRVCHGPEAQ